MRIESKLCHFSENKVIVKVDGWLHEKNLGSALAEGPTVEIAEDKAISRLSNRINKKTNEDLSLQSNNQIKIKDPLKVELPKSDKFDKITFNQEPSDWSNELTAIDVEIERLKWTRDDEINFLKNNLGFNNRSNITDYNDIIKYLEVLKKIDNVTSTNVINTSITNLIEESDIILRDLNWDHKQGRQFLQDEFNVLTRKELDEKQLTSFVAKLKSIRNNI
tara:strand:+ start:36 stop:695 length:660 start_codon:yes stop_codon:yes gene_type:complete